MTHNEICEVVTLGSDPEEMHAIVDSLLDSRLVAAGHVSAPVASRFAWAGQIRAHYELRVTLHTRTSLFDQVAAFIRNQHSYELPCVIATPITLTTVEYREWVLRLTEQPIP